MSISSRSAQKSKEGTGGKENKNTSIYLGHFHLFFRGKKRIKNTLSCPFSIVFSRNKEKNKHLYLVHFHQHSRSRRIPAASSRQEKRKKGKKHKR
jgi:hypothetical protein